MTNDLLYLIVNALIISLISFGGGAQALFYQTAVLQRPLISSDDLSAVLAFGYATPGPAVFGTATFIGYHLAGVPGAVAGSVGVFLMPCLLSLLAARYIGHWLTNKHATFFIKGVGLAAAGLVAATAIGVAHPSSLSLWHLAIMLGSLGVMLRWRKLNPLLVLVLGGALGLLD